MVQKLKTSASLEKWGPNILKNFHTSARLTGTKIPRILEPYLILFLFFKCEIQTQQNGKHRYR